MDKSIAFIICVNDETYFEECLFYINRLRLPDGYVAEVYPVRQAQSIFQGYNMAMQQSQAQYKVYMHQDVFLIDKDMIRYFLKLFEEQPKAGIAGVLGTNRYSNERSFFRSWNLGNVLGCSEEKAFHNNLSEEPALAAALDGMFLMTSKDLPWREDVLSGWDFYDISQSLEFGRNRRQLWVLAGKKPWCIHDCGYLNLTGYDEAQEAFLEIYRKDLPDYAKRAPVYPQRYREKHALMMELKEQWKPLLFMGKLQEVRAAVPKVWDERFIDTELAIFRNILEILQKEERAGIPKEEGFLYDCGSFGQAQKKYLKTKFYIRRKKYAADDVGLCPSVSAAAMRVIRKHTMMQRKA